MVSGRGKRKSELQQLYESVRDFKEKLVFYKTHLEIMGENRNSYSKSDKDATFMRMKDDHMQNGQLKAGYSVQAAVSNEYIVSVGLYDSRSDQKTFIPFMKKYNELYGFHPRFPVADAGYGSYDNYSFCIENSMELVQKYTMFSKEREKKYKNNPFRAENFSVDDEGNYYCPMDKKFVLKNITQNRLYKYPNETKVYECESCEGCSEKSNCSKAKGNRTIRINEKLNEMHETVRENLNSPQGIELRKQRSIQVEGAFGVIKENMKYRRFTRTGHQSVKLELLLVCIGYNLKKFHNKSLRNKSYQQLLL